MRVLITGVSGFVGRHLADYCAEQQAAVVGLGRRPQIAANPPELLESYLSADLLEFEQIEQAVQSAQPDRIFHLAAEASVARSWEDPASIMTSNLQGTLNLLEAARRHTPEARVHIAGSGEEYGRPEQLPLTEEQVPRPQNPYAVSKVAAGTVAGLYADAYGLHVVRTRAFNHSGPGQSAAYVIAAFASQIAEGELQSGGMPIEISTGNTNVRRDFTDVRDIVRAYWLALERCDPGVYNVCSGKPTSVERILNGLVTIAKVPVRSHVEARLLRENEVEEIYGSRDRLSAAIAWEPSISLLETLSDTLDWWREKVRAEVHS